MSHPKKKKIARRKVKLSTRRIAILVIISALILITSLLPFSPTSVVMVKDKPEFIAEQLFPVFENSNFENISDDRMVGWNLTEGARISSIEGKVVVNMTSYAPLAIPKITYIGKNATKRFLLGANVVFSLEAKVLKPVFDFEQSYISLLTLIIHNKTKTPILFKLVLYKKPSNLTDGLYFTNNSVIAYKSLKDTSDWTEYFLQTSKLEIGLFKYLRDVKGITDVNPGDRYEIFSFVVGSSNLVSYVDNVSLYLLEPKWFIATIRSNSIIPMNIFLSDIRINGSKPSKSYIEPDLVMPFSLFNLYAFIPYIPSNNTYNIVTIKFSTGQTIEFHFIEVTRRIWVTF